ncbi:MAG: hypothetical protein ACK55R_01815 [Cyanobacteriota bacterium]
MSRRFPVPLFWAVVLLLGVLAPAMGRAASLEDIKRLEDLINASGTKTVVSDNCPPDHAGYYESDGKATDRLVICRNNVNLGDVDAVWEVMAHESTHIMQACTGSTAIPDERMPRTYRELQTMAPHYAKLVGRSYASADQRLEAEAVWMELQTPQVVIELFQSNCARFLQPRR